MLEKFDNHENFIYYIKLMFVTFEKILYPEYSTRDFKKSVE